MLSEKQIAELVEKPLHDAGYDLVTARFKKENGDLYLQIVIDRYEDIAMDDVVKATNIISSIIDDENVCESRYILDVTSLGAEKPIKVDDLSHYVGRYINIHITSPIKGANILEGTLVSLEGESAKISYREKTRTIVVDVPLKDIDKARLAIKF